MIILDSATVINSERLIRLPVSKVSHCFICQSLVGISLRRVNKFLARLRDCDLAARPDLWCVCRNLRQTFN